MIATTHASVSAALVMMTAVTIGCGAEMVRPRASGEPFSARSGRALVVGQFDVKVEGLEENSVGTTRHRVMVGDQVQMFTDEIPTESRTFALWVYPGVFCFARPTYGGRAIGGGAPCAEIPEGGKAYYVGSAQWTVTKGDKGPEAVLEIRDLREEVAGSKMLVGIYPETAFVASDLKAEQIAKKYTLP